MQTTETPWTSRLGAATGSPALSSSTPLAVRNTPLRLLRNRSAAGRQARSSKSSGGATAPRVRSGSVWV